MSIRIKALRAAFKDRFKTEIADALGLHEEWGPNCQTRRDLHMHTALGILSAWACAESLHDCGQDGEFDQDDPADCMPPIPKDLAEAREEYRKVCRVFAGDF